MRRRPRKHQTSARPSRRPSSGNPSASQRASVAPSKNVAAQENAANKNAAAVGVQKAMASQSKKRKTEVIDLNDDASPSPSKRQAVEKKVEEKKVMEKRVVKNDVKERKTAKKKVVETEAAETKAMSTQVDKSTSKISSWGGLYRCIKETLGLASSSTSNAPARATAKTAPAQSQMVHHAKPVPKAAQRLAQHLEVPWTFRPWIPLSRAL
jgi:hypothetical protein